MNKRAEVVTVLMISTATIIVASFIGTVMDGTFAKQIQKIKNAHKAPITVDR